MLLYLKMLYHIIHDIPRIKKISIFGPKNQDFSPKIKILKRNQCILRIRGAPVCQKLGMILENTVIQKFKLEKHVSYIDIFK